MEILAWIIIGGLVGALAGRARGQTAGGAFIGALLGPIGWLLTLCSRDVRLKCIECGGVLVEGARRCQHCGSVVDKQFQIRCPKCGHQGEVHALKMNEKIECPSCKKTFAAESARVIDHAA